MLEKSDPKLVKEETDFDVNDRSRSENARHARWLTLMDQNKGKIDVALGQKFLASSPRISSEATDISQDWIQKMIPEILDQLMEQYPELKQGMPGPSGGAEHMQH